jgi:hypothetical protein
MNDCGVGAAPPQLAANTSDVGVIAGPPPSPLPESGSGAGRGPQIGPFAEIATLPVTPLATSGVNVAYSDSAPFDPSENEGVATLKGVAVPASDALSTLAVSVTVAADVPVFVTLKF